MDSSTFLLFLVLIGLALSTGNQTMTFMAIGVGILLLILMGGAHHLIVALVALGVVYVGWTYSQSTKHDEYMLYALLIAAALFIIFVLHGKEDSAGGGMEAYGMGGGLPPMGY